MSTSDPSFSILADTPSPPPNDEDDIDSLPSTDSRSSLDDDDAHYDSDAEREWRESLQQLELMLTIVVVPYIGKYFGRKCAYWGEFLCATFLLAGGLGARTGCSTTNWLTGCSSYRLGKVHGVETSES
jgi:hypothetical protein